MRLSIHVQQLRDATLLICIGQIVQGQEADYLFSLITQRDGDVVLDMNAVSHIDEEGLFLIVLSYELLRRQSANSGCTALLPNWLRN
jgi:anti-anti-sigma regulatory factor